MQHPSYTLFRFKGYNLAKHQVSTVILRNPNFAYSPAAHDDNRTPIPPV